ncbi:TOMM precursor leader peptide-binding protein [Bacillus sp. RAR_GA_16]|uniref:TOMM precursor leader peptide-binding protein n=1 Tax=Bacillus sp. RAR_GA_16 TaxID=2876774 RepID=UPI001CCEF49F|nr:TOMM precursor leader peptide-binding protein [Bacillus sp. RAR_GA_16]MCA0172904.1 TOMM precursor leader peptide-binding protein [Bacillus sp. RAR_GA_16]
MSITLVGNGLLRDCVAEQLAPHCTLTLCLDFEETIPLNTSLLLVIHDSWNPSIHKQAEEVARELGINWLRAFFSFGEGVIGPLVRPGQEGCSQCADTRKMMAATDREDLWKIQQSFTDGNSVQDQWVSQTGILHMAQLIKNEVLASRSTELDGAIYLLNMASLESSRHRILPDAYCSVCSSLPEDTDAVMTLKPSLKVSGYRTRSIDDLRNVLSKDYLDSRTGLLNRLMIDFETTYADAIVNLPLFNGNEGSAGRTNSYAMSQMTAILEGLERSCGIDPKGKRTVVHDSYRNLKHALNPLQLGVHAEEQYAERGYPFTPFHPDRKMNWVWGYSLLKQEPIFVPERLAYYSMGCGDGFVFETSNGCAIGGSLEEAIFYGMMEVLERDSFLITWYAQLSLPQIDPYSSNDEELHLMIDRMQEITGYDLYLYNATMEHGIPCILTITKNRTADSDRLNLMCAAGAHLDPVRAVKSAIFESVGMITPLNKEFKKKKDDFLAMYHDSSLVKKMDDHGMVYGLPEAEERLHFLLNQNRPLQTFQEAFQPAKPHDDLTEDLNNLLQTFRHLNLDVIVVDQTTPEIKRNGLHCAKVIIPGMLPMTFGHHLRRVNGLSRVLKVPKELGYVDRELTAEELNPYPHPFP